MRARECFRSLSEIWNDEIVVCSLGTACQEWWKITGSDRPFYMNSSMGLASSFGLGLSMTIPDVPVWVIDSDGALSMNLSSLLTEARYRPRNLVHFLLANDCYQVIDGYPLVNAERMDWAQTAQAVGIKNTFTYDSVDDLKANIQDDVFSQDEHAFVVLQTEKEDSRPLEIPFEGPEVKYRFGRYLETRTGSPVFGKYGY